MEITQSNLKWFTCSFSGQNMVTCEEGKEQESLFFSFDIPEKVKSYFENKGIDIDFTYFQLGYHAPRNSVTWNLGAGSHTYPDSDYDELVAPFVALFEAEKDRLEQEQQQALEEYAKFANRQERALTKITEDYGTVLERGFVRTSLGFDADISCDSSATLLGTQTSLAYTMRTLGEGDGIPKTVFRDFYGLKRELDVVQVERLICEINGAQNHIREQKYLFKGRVKDETSDNESLNAVLEDCVYSTLDFSNLDEAGNPAEIQFNETKSIAERIDAPYM